MSRPLLTSDLAPWAGSPMQAESHQRRCSEATRLRPQSYGDEVAYFQCLSSSFLRVIPGEEAITMVRSLALNINISNIPIFVTLT
mmetsp:Transcript_18686/g.40480  ORF Transcript_18686/g.40480 Transcript_18686/m.40480 type:complete len:85 (-) Transcript_18686:1327-1581(-)